MPIVDSEENPSVLPVYVVGDSHALPYRNLVYRERFVGDWVMVRSKYIAGLSAHNVFSPETEEFHPGIIDFLEYEGLVREGRATHLSTDRIDFAIAHAAGRPVVAPLILLTCGDIDIRAAWLPLLKDEYDFVPPFEMPYPVSDRQLLPWDVCLNVIGPGLKSLEAGLRQLKKAGFQRMYVQSVVPPTMDDANFRARHRYACPAATRTRAVFAYNQILKAHCAAAEIPVVDIWPAVTVQGYLKPEFELDGVHLSPSSARMHVDQMLEDSLNNRDRAVNFVRHEMYYRAACGLPYVEGANLSEVNR